MPSPDLSAILSCSYGTTDLAVVDFEIKETCDIDAAGGGRVGTVVEIDADCLLTGSGSAADFATRSNTIRADLSKDGRDFLLKGLAGETLYVLPAAICMLGGPFTDIDMLPGSQPLQMKFKLKIYTKTSTPPGANNQSGTPPPLDSFKMTVQTRADNLTIVTRTGTITGANATAQYLNVVKPAVDKNYKPPGWVVEHTYQAEQTTAAVNNLTASYQIVATEMAANLPTAQGDQSVQGEVTTRVERDEQYRQTTTTEIDLLMTKDGDGQDFATMFRAQAQKGGATILRENVAITSVREKRVRASFVTIASGDKSPLLDWEETVTVATSDSWEIKTYPGADPVVVQRPKGIAKITQTGKATAVGKFKKPAPIFNSFLEDPQVTMTDVNAVVKQTTWHYQMYASSGGNTPDTSYNLASFDASKIARSAQDDNYLKGGK